MRNILLLLTTLAAFNNTVLAWLFRPLWRIDNQFDRVTNDLYDAITPFTIFSAIFVLIGGFLFFTHLNKTEEKHTIKLLPAEGLIMIAVIHLSYIMIDGNPVPIGVIVVSVLLSGLISLIYRKTISFRTHFMEFIGNIY